MENTVGNPMQKPYLISASETLTTSVDLWKLISPLIVVACSVMSAYVSDVSPSPWVAFKIPLEFSALFPIFKNLYLHFYAVTYELNIFRSISCVSPISRSKNQRAMSIVNPNLAIISRLERVPSLDSTVVHLITGDNKTFTLSYIQRRFRVSSLQIHLFQGVLSTHER